MQELQKQGFETKDALNVKKDAAQLKDLKYLKNQVSLDHLRRVRKFRHLPPQMSTKNSKQIGCILKSDTQSQHACQ